MELPQNYRRILWMRRFSVLPSVGFAIFSALTHFWFGFVIHTFLVISLTTIGELTHRSYIKNGYRIAAGNRHHPGTSPTQTTGTASPGTATIGTSKGSGITGTSADIPIIAFKSAQLVASAERGPFLQSRYSGEAYDDSDMATCRKLLAMPKPTADQFHPGKAPVLDCTCGFYAVKRPEQLGRFDPTCGYAFLEVELFGRVIVHDRGYRAERQRILHIGIPGCAYMVGGGEFCAEKPTYLLELTGPMILEEPVPLLSCCAKHLPDFGGIDAWKVHTIEEVAEVLHHPVGPIL